MFEARDQNPEDVSCNDAGMREGAEDLSMPRIAPQEEQVSDEPELHERAGRTSRYEVHMHEQSPENGNIPIPTAYHLLGPSLVVRDIAAVLRNAADKFVESNLTGPVRMGFMAEGGDVVNAKPFLAKLDGAKKVIAKMISDGSDFSPGAINARVFAYKMERTVEEFRAALIRGGCRDGLAQNALDGVMQGALEFKAQVTAVMLNIDAAIANVGISVDPNEGGDEGDQDQAA